MRIAYADPPYLGQAKKHYSHDENCAEVNHRLLISYLETFDAWALSCSSPSLKEVLNLCPDDVRVAAWVKPFASFKPNVNPAYTWEPVIFKVPPRPRTEPTVKDHVIASITLKRGLAGAKPYDFCVWLLQLLNVRGGDEFVDVFPGSGAVTVALESVLSGKPVQDELFGEVGFATS